MSGLIGMFLNSLDMTSAANDVIIVRHKNGTLKSTPFNVRFGKAKVIRPGDKVVQIEVNGKMTKALMKMGSDGEAFWLEPTTSDEGRAESPLGSPTRSPIAEANIDAIPPMTIGSAVSDAAPGQRSAAGGAGSPTKSPPGAAAAAAHHQPTASNAIRVQQQPSPLASPVVNSPRVRLTPQSSPSGASVSSGTPQFPPAGSASSSHVDPHHGGLQLPPAATAQSPGADVAAVAASGSHASFVEDLKAELREEGARGRIFEELLMSVNVTEMELAEQQLSSGAVPGADGGEAEGSARSFPALDTAHPITPDSSHAAHVRFADASGGDSPGVTAGGGGGGGGGGGESPPLGAVHHHRTHSEAAAAKLTLSRFASVDNFDVFHSASGAVGGHTPSHRASLPPGGGGGVDALGGQTPPQPQVSQLAPQQSDAANATGAAAAAAATVVLPVTTSSLNTSAAEDGDEGSGEDFDDEAADDDLGEDEETETDDEEARGEDDERHSKQRAHYRRTLRPITSDIISLNLKEGINTVRYITHTTLRGRVVVEGRIFLWSSQSKLVISDVDGTVTKSDVLGHLFTFIGRDWTHPGICSLYNKVARNGYHFVYLTARSVSQIEATRNFLMGVRQDGEGLPPGPVITAPDKIWNALTQEVTKRSHEFKIVALKNIAAAFPASAKPFYAGFGNRIGDVIAYTATGVPKHKIFIIDPHSVVHVCHVKQTYKDLSHLVDETFAPRPHEAYPNEKWAAVPSEGPASVAPIAVATASPAAASAAAASGSPRTHSLATSPPSAAASATGGATAEAFLGANRPASVASDDSDDVRSVASATGGAPMAAAAAGGSLSATKRTADDEIQVDDDYNSFNYWKVRPEDLIAPEPAAAAKSSKQTTSGGGASAPAAGSWSPGERVGVSPYAVSADDGTASHSSEGATSYTSATDVAEPSSASPPPPASSSGGSSWLFWRKRDPPATIPSSLPATPAAL